MEKVYFFVGALIGGVIGIIAFELISTQNPKDNDTVQDYDPIVYLEKAESYEDKGETSFKVFKVLSDAALMREVSDKENKRYFGKIVLIYGKYFYNDQVVTVSKPQRVGTYRYTDITDVEMTVPIIEGKIE